MINTRDFKDTMTTLNQVAPAPDVPSAPPQDVQEEGRQKTQGRERVEWENSRFEEPKREMKHERNHFRPYPRRARVHPRGA